MASVFQVLGSLQQQVSLVTRQLTSARGGPLTVMVGIDWPSVKVLQANVKDSPQGGTSAVVTIFDRKMMRNTTRWNPIVLNQTIVPATLTSAVTQVVIPPLGSGQITLGGPVTNGDAVSCVLTNPGVLSTGNFDIQTRRAATVVSGTGADTPSTMAYRLVQAIGEEPTLSSWVTATQAANVVNLTSLVGAQLQLLSATGNGGSEVTEIGRRERELQVVVWTTTIEDRNTIGDALETMLASMEMFLGAYPAGLVFGDGSAARVCVRNDYFLDDATLSDTYRRDLHLAVDYSITTTDTLYAMLAPVQQYRAEFIGEDLAAKFRIGITPIGGPM